MRLVGSLALSHATTCSTYDTSSSIRAFIIFVGPRAASHWAYTRLISSRLGKLALPENTPAIAMA